MVIDLSKISPLVKINRVNSEPKRILKPLAYDTVEISGNENVVKVDNAIMKKAGKYEKIISPQFNGCQGVLIYSGGKVFFGHFPPFWDFKMEDAINSALEKFDDSENAKVAFIVPTAKDGTQDAKFDDYKNMILGKFKNADFEYLTYPRRSKGATYQYTGIIDNGVLKSSLEKVPYRPQSGQF